MTPIKRQLGSERMPCYANPCYAKQRINAKMGVNKSILYFHNYKKYFTKKISN